MKISIEDFFKYSVLLWTSEQQRDYCLNHFKIAFNGLFPKPIHGFEKHKSHPPSTCFLSGNNNCNFGHAMCLRIAEFLNWPFICVFEQDAWIYGVNVKEFETALQNIPDDCTTIVFGLTKNSMAIKEKCLYPHDNTFFEKVKDHPRKKQLNVFCGSQAVLTLKNGFNNRMFQLIRAGYPDNWSFSNDMKMCYSLRQYFIQNNIPDYVKYTIHSCQDTCPILLKGGLGNQLFQIAKYMSDNVHDFYEYTGGDVRKLNDTFRLNLAECENDKTEYAVFHGYFQSEKYFNIDLIKEKFKLKTDIVETIKEKYSNVDFNDCVAVYIRLTDYPDHTDRYFMPNAKWYEDKYLKYFNGKQCLVFSDDIEECKNMINIKNAIFVKNQTETDDLYTIALCKHHICSNSTFGWWGCWLNEQPDSINVFPKIWFCETWKNKDKQYYDIQNNIIPKRWKRD